ncbi:hypothetical protein DL98DRAFT_517303 [Cadophora sp. DSE1049]|nr:hypothetical protein DL98DRAFT_517303 [Cadophora sp. DSE1049]
MADTPTIKPSATSTQPSSSKTASLYSPTPTSTRTHSGANTPVSAASHKAYKPTSAATPSCITAHKATISNKPETLQPT